MGACAASPRRRWPGFRNGCAYAARSQASEARPPQADANCLAEGDEIESSSNRCVFVVSSHVGKVLKLPCVSYPASASVLTGDAKPLGVGCERPPGLLRPFSGCRMWSVSSGS